MHISLKKQKQVIISTALKYKSVWSNEKKFLNTKSVSSNEEKSISNEKMVSHFELRQKTIYGYFGQFVGLHNTPRAKITKIVISVTFPIQTGGSVGDQSTEWATLPRWCL